MPVVYDPTVLSVLSEEPVTPLKAKIMASLQLKRAVRYAAFCCDAVGMAVITVPILGHVLKTELAAVTKLSL